MNTKNKLLLTVPQSILIGIFIFFLPFNHALTLNYIFPVKVSELAIFLFFCTTFISEQNRKYLISFREHIFFKIGLLFLIALAISTVINLFWKYPYQLDYYSARFNPKADSLLKLIYVFVAFYSCGACIAAFKDNKRLFLDIFIWGAVLASCYCWYLFSFSLFKIQYYTLPGSEVYPQAALFKFGNFIRCGTFKEGNMMGMFLVTAGIIAIYARKYFIAVFLFATIITTASSMAIFCTIAFLMAYFTKVLLQMGAKKLLSVLYISALALIIICLQFQDFRYMASKIVPISGVEYKDAVYSQSQRYNLVNVSMKIGLDNPVLGVGLTNFAWHYLFYNDKKEFLPRKEKILSNNVFAEIFAEAGFPSLLLFLFVILICYRTTIRHKSLVLQLGLIVSVIYWLAFPTFTVLFSWCFLGLILSQDKLSWDEQG